VRGFSHPLNLLGKKGRKNRRKKESRWKIANAQKSRKFARAGSRIGERGIIPSRGKGKSLQKKGKKVGGV